KLPLVPVSNRNEMPALAATSSKRIGRSDGVADRGGSDGRPIVSGTRRATIAGMPTTVPTSIHPAIRLRQPEMCIASLNRIDRGHHREIAARRRKLRPVGGAHEASPPFSRLDAVDAAMSQAILHTKNSLDLARPVGQDTASQSLGLFEASPGDMI